MIVLQDNKYVVMNTITKEVISEHEFDTTSKQAQRDAKELAYDSNRVWKESVQATS